MATRPKKRQPRRRDPAATRALLLEHAGHAFAALGHDGARIDDIAAAAGVNKRMIYAYYGDKDGLYLAVLDAHLSRITALARPDDPAAPAVPARAQAESVVRRYFEFLTEHEDFARLLSWEALSRERRGRRILVERVGAGLEPLHEVLRRGIARGEFRADLDPRLFSMSVNALLVGWVNHRSFLETLWDADLGAPQARERVLASILRLLFEGIEA
jgi:TetR/AcrR family transcriptional regulator